MKKNPPRRHGDTETSQGFTAQELRTIRALKTPHGIQRLIDQMPYHLAGTSWSPRMVLRERTCHCLEGAIFGAAALRALGFPALIVDLEAENDTDHVIAVFNVRGHWGAIGKSNYTGCRYREPVHRSIRELAISYFDVYFNLRGERSLRRYSKPVDLARFDHLNWMTAEKSVWFIAEYLCEIPHFPLLKPWMAKNLNRLDKRSFDAGTLGLRRKSPESP